MLTERTTKNKDWVKANWAQRQKLAVKVGKSLVESLMKNYQEPTRAGTRKGNPIGLSQEKKRAALLMILYPTGAGLNEIAKIAHVSPGVLRVWRTQRDFTKATTDACNTVREAILNTIHNELIDYSPKGLRDPFLEIKEVDPGQMRYFLLKILPFFNPFIVHPVMGTILKNVESSIAGYAELWFGLGWVLAVKDEKSYRKWRSRPEIKEFTRTIINSWIDLISDPEAIKELGPEKLQKTKEDLKEFVFQELDV